MSKGTANTISIAVTTPCRWLARAVALSTLLAAAGASAAIHVRGEFRFEVAEIPSWVVQHEVPASWDAQFRDAPTTQWRNWLFDTQVDRRHGQRVRYVDSVVEPISSEMIGEAGKIQLWFNPEYQQLTLHRIAIRRDGKWLDRLVPDAVTLARREAQFEQNMSTGTVSALLVIDDVRAGDLVRTSYSVSGMNPILDGLSNEEMPFAALDPLLERHARVLFDPGAKIAEHRDPDTPDPSRKSIPGALEWSAHAHAVAPIIDEGSYPRWYAPIPMVTVGIRHEWAEIAAWAARLYPAPKPLPDELKQRIAVWRAMPDMDARIAAALRATQEEVRYFGIEMGSNSHQPSEPAETWERRYGDCKDKARLLVTLLGELDVEAYPALVSAGWEKRAAALPPAASSFDHVIVQVRLPDATLWLDPTQTQQRGSVRSFLPGSYGVALPVSATTRELADVVATEQAADRIKVEERFVPDPAGEHVGYSIRTEYQGASAQRMRSYLQTAGRETVARAYESIYRRRYGDLETVGELGAREDDPSGGLVIDERYLLKSPWVSGSSGHRVLETLADAIAEEIQLPRTAERSSPYAIRYPALVEQSTVFEMPSGWTWDSAPVDKVLEDKGLRLSIDARQVGDELRIDWRYKALQASLDAEGFAGHYDLLRAANDLDNWRIVISPPAREARKQRNERLQKLMRGLLDEHAQRNTRNSGD